MGCCCNHDTLVLIVRPSQYPSEGLVTYKNKEQSGQDDANSSAKAVDAKSEDYHTEDVTDQD